MENYQSSITCYHESLTIWTLKANRFSMGMFKLTCSYLSKLAELENSKGCRKAIHGYEWCYKWRSWAARQRFFDIQMGLGDMFLKIAEIEKNMTIAVMHLALKGHRSR